MILLFINQAISVVEFITELKHVIGLVILEIFFVDLSFYSFKNNVYIYIYIYIYIIVGVCCLKKEHDENLWTIQWGSSANNSLKTGRYLCLQKHVFEFFVKIFCGLNGKTDY